MPEFKKEALAQVFSWDTIFIEHLRATVSVNVKRHVFKTLSNNYDGTAKRS